MDTKRFLSKPGLALVCMIGLAFLGFWFLSPAPLIGAGAFFPNSPIPFPPIGDPELELEITVDNENPQAGDEIEYTLSYANVIPGSQAFIIRVYYFLPAGTHFLSTDPETDAYQNGALLFTRHSLGPTPSVKQAKVRVRVLEGYNKLYNHGLIVANGVTPAHSSLMTQVTQPPVSLRLVKTGYSAVLINDELVYTLMCENTSDIIVNEVTLIDVLPTALPLVGASPMPDATTLPALTWSLGDLGPGERRTVVVTTTAPALTGVVTNTALVDAQQRVVTQAVWATHVISQGAILRVDKTGSAPAVQLGDELIYTLRYENAGNEIATGIKLTDTFPSGISVNAVSPSASEMTIQRGVWDLPDLNPDDRGHIAITTTVGGAGGRTLLNVADVAGQPDSFPGHAWLETKVWPSLIYLPLMARDY